MCGILALIGTPWQASARAAPGIPDAFTEAHMVDAYERVLTGG